MLQPGHASITQRGVTGTADINVTRVCLIDLALKYFSNPFPTENFRLACCYLQFSIFLSSTPASQHVFRVSASFSAKMNAKLNFHPVTLTYKHDSDRVEMNHHAKYLTYLKDQFENYRRKLIYKYC